MFYVKIYQCTDWSKLKNPKLKLKMKTVIETKLELKKTVTENCNDTAYT